MKNNNKKSVKKPTNLEEKVDFIIDFLNYKVALKTDIHNLDTKFQTLLSQKADKTDILQVQTQIDNLAKLIKDYHQEMVFLVRRVQKMENWIQKASLKLGIPYEF